MIHVTFIAMIHVTLVMQSYASPSVAQVSSICLVTPPQHRHNHSLRHLSTEMPVKKKVEKDESTTKEAAASSRGTGDDIVAQVEAQQQLTAENNPSSSFCRISNTEVIANMSYCLASPVAFCIVLTGNVCV